MAQPTCEVPTEHRKTYGFGQKFLNSLGLSDLSGTDMRTLAKNLGVDDLRAVELRGEKAHLFGKNLKDIDFWGGGSVPSNTIVKKQHPDGELEYFISRGKATSEPSKWYVDGTKVFPHPEWVSVGKNVTVDKSGALKRFKRQDNGTYIADETGDTVLKVTKPYDPQGGKPPAQYKLAEQGYDAILMGDGSYKLLDEPSQALDRSFVLIDEGTSATGKTTEQIKPDEVTEQEVAEHSETLNIGRTVGYGTAGFVAGELVDNWTDSDNYGWAGGALGMLLSTPKVRSKFEGIFRGSGDNIPEQSRHLDEVEQSHEEYINLKRHGYAGHPKDEAAKTEFKEKVVNTWESLKQRGQEAWSFAFKNKLFESAYGNLLSIGGREVRRFLQDLKGVETHHTTLVREHWNAVERFFGSDINPQSFKQIKKDIVKRYADSVGLNVERLSEEEIENMFGSAVFRIISYDGKLRGGKFVFDDEMEAAKKAYQSDVNREIDRFFLEDEQGRQAIQAYRETFDAYGKEAIKTYRDAVISNTAELSGEQGRVIMALLDSDLSVKQWKENMNGNQLHTIFKNSLQNKAFNETVQYIETINKIKSLEGRYVPQMRSPAKEDTLRSNFFARWEQENPNATAKQKEQAWRRYRTSLVVANNRDGYKAMQISASGDNIEPILKRNETELIKLLRDDLVYRIVDDEVRQFVVRDVASLSPQTMKRYVGKTQKNGKTYYYLKDPEIPDGDGGIYPFLEEINAKEIERADQTFLKMTTLVQSDHLDNPRNFMLPTSMIETNMENIVRRYAMDAGNKLYMVQKKMDTDRKLGMRLETIRKELKERGYDKDNFADDIDTIEAWYSNITRTSDAIEVNMSSEDIIKRYNDKKRNHKIISTLMNFGYMPFLWFTSFYSVFQPFITGPFMASYGNIFKTYKQYFKNPEQLKNTVNELRKMGIISDKMKDFAPEINYGIDEQSFLGGKRSGLDWIYDISRKGVEFSGGFSLMRKMLEHPAIGIDIEDTGLLRFFGGNMTDIAGVESALTTQAVLYTIEDMVTAGRKLLDDESLSQVTVNGKSYRMGDIRRRLEQLGVDNPDYFIEQSAKINDSYGTTFMQGFNNKLAGKEPDQFTLPPYLAKEYNKISDTIVNQLHGRTKLSRPLWWTNNPYGRMLSQFSVYSQNFGVQTLGNRIYRPIKEYFEEYQIPQDQSIMRLMWHMKRGNDEYVKKVFTDSDGNLLRTAQGDELWKKAYDDFPIDAFDNLFKVAPVVMGTGAAMMATRDVWMDFINVVANEAIGNDDYEAWKNTRERLNYAKEIFDGNEVGWDMAKMTGSALRNAVDMGFTGRAAQLFINDSRYTQGGVWSKTPVTGMFNDFYEASTTWSRVSAEDALPKTAKAISEELMLRFPITGSFHGLRSGLSDMIWKQPKNRDVTFTDAETGQTLSDLRIMME